MGRLRRPARPAAGVPHRARASPRQAGRGQAGKPPTGSPRSAPDRPVPGNSRPSSGATGTSRTGCTTCATSPTTRTAAGAFGHLPRNLACRPTRPSPSGHERRFEHLPPANRHYAAAAGSPRRRPGPAVRLSAASRRIPRSAIACAGLSSSTGDRTAEAVDPHHHQKKTFERLASRWWLPGGSERLSEIACCVGRRMEPSNEYDLWQHTHQGKADQRAA